MILSAQPPFAVKNRGKVVFVYPARRSNTLLAALHEQRLTPKRLQPVYSYPGAAECPPGAG